METFSTPVLTFVLNATWQVTLIVGLAALVGRFLRRSPARYRHIVLSTALVLAVLVPISSTRKPDVTASLPSVQPVVFDGSALGGEERGGVSEAALSPRDLSFSPRLAEVVATAYALLVLYGGIQLLRGLLKARLLRARAEAAVPSAALGRVWRTCRAVFGVHAVELLRSPEVSGPVAVGVRRRAVILPQVLWEQSSEEVLTAAIGHELAHVARRDFLTNVLHQVLLIPISFHPAAWYQK